MKLRLRLAIKGKFTGEERARALPSDLKYEEKESTAMSISRKLCHFPGLHQPCQEPIDGLLTM